MAAKSAPRSVDDYLATLDAPSRRALERLRAQVRNAAPKAREKIAYGMPAYVHEGFLVSFAAWKKNLALYAVGKDLIRDLAKELRPFEVTGDTIHFWADKPLPASLVKRIVRQRVRENESRKKA